MSQIRLNARLQLLQELKEWPNRCQKQYIQPCEPQRQESGDGLCCVHHGLCFVVDGDENCQTVMQEDIPP